ncbi:hypothetical protein [Plantactinospora sp. CA-290183]|uniref:hypothetical protein n=1 Tax=Plantactinospora sp. CA-290183 TaxID=3240006 RepID=UPI003D8E82C1
MLAPTTQESIVAALTHTENVVDQHAGWNVGPVLIGVFHQPHRDGPRIEVVPFPLGPAIWTVAHPHRARTNLPVPMVLRAVVDVVASPLGSAWLPGWLHQDGRALLAVGFICEGWTTSGYTGYQYGDLDAVPAMADHEVRTVTAYDTDGRLYQIIRERGSQAEVTVESQPALAQRHSHITDALYRLIAVCSG